MEDISFSIKKGYIMGFIGPNGAGKTTTIKAIMNLIYPDSGEIKVFGKDHIKFESEIKERIGFVYDEPVYYDALSLERMTGLIRPFYSKWNQWNYEKYIKLFNLDEKQKVGTLSKGMKMRYSLALALSHEAELIIMDEPTSGLDPIFRREMLEILYEVIQKEENSIFFSTHITSDLDRIADYITFIDNGKLVFSEAKDDIFDRYRLVRGGNEELTEELKGFLVGYNRSNVGFEALATGAVNGTNLEIERPTLEDIMYFHTKSERPVE